MMRTLALALAALACFVPARPDGQTPRFRSGADAVLVDVEVRKDGRPVSGLTAKDFELKDRGVRQMIEAVSLDDIPLSVVLALDVSTSVRGDALEDLKDAARKAAGTLRSGDESALITFSFRVALATRWTTDRTPLGDAIDALTAGGLTCLYDAVFAGISMRERAKGRTLLLVFTDGVDTASWLDGPSVIEAARRSDIVVYAVTAGRQANGLGDAERDRGQDGSVRRAYELEPDLVRWEFLDLLTKDTGGELIHVGASRDLADVFSAIVRDFKTRYVLSYAPAGVPASGWHPIEVKLKGRAGQVRARRGYFR